MREWLSEHKGTIVVLIWLVVMVIMADHYYNFRLAEKATSFIHNINPIVDDCGSDKSCFMKHLQFCEKAKFEPNEKGTIELFGSDFSYLAGSCLEIQEFITHKIGLDLDYLGIGPIKHCKVKYVLPSGDVKYCYFRTDSPDSTEISENILFEGCRKARE